MDKKEVKELENFLEIVGKGNLDYKIDKSKSVSENKKEIVKLCNKKGYKVKIEAKVVKGGGIKKNVKSKKEPKIKRKEFPNISKREFDHLMSHVPDSHSLDDADKENDYEGLCSFMLDEWGVEVPEIPPRNKKELKERERQQREEAERLRLEQERKKIAEMIEKEDELGDKIIKENKVTSRVMKASSRDIRDEITRYNPHCEASTWSSLFSLMFKERYNVLNLGSGGIGKSRSNFALVKKKGKDFCPLSDTFGDVVTVSGHITPKRFFQYLKQNPILIIDESYSVLRNQLIQHLLRGALYDGFVVWNSTKDEGDDEHTFEGSIIFNTNMLGNNLNDKALMDRTFCNNLKLNKEQIKDKIRQRRIYEPKKEVWDLIRNRLIAVRRGKVNIELTEDEKDLVYDFAIRKVEEIGDKGDFSVRSVERTERIFKAVKTFFGYLDVELIDFAKKLSGNYFVVEHNEEVTEKGRMDEAKGKVLGIVEGKKKIKMDSLLREVIKKGICGKSTLYNFSNELEKEGKIVQKGKRNKTILITEKKRKNGLF